MTSNSTGTANNMTNETLAKISTYTPYVSDQRYCILCGQHPREPEQPTFNDSQQELYEEEEEYQQEDLQQQPKRKPNILFIMTDQQRFDTLRRVQEELSHYDNITAKIDTPNLDRLSYQGAYFRHAYCQCPVCAPARAALRTGCTMERSGIQTNELIDESVYGQSPWLKERVEALQGMDSILSTHGNYHSEYYGKFHLPDHLWESIYYNDYDYDLGGPYFVKDKLEKKIKRFLKYHEQQGNISKDLEEPQQLDSFTKFPYTPFPIDSRYGYPSGTKLSSDHFQKWEKSQPNVCGENALDANFTNSYFTADMALKALDRLLSEQEEQQRQQTEGIDYDADENTTSTDPPPFLLTPSFHNPHPPMIPATQHLQSYKEQQDELFVSHNLYDDLQNADYVGEESPKYKDRAMIQGWTALYYALITEIDELVGVLLDRLDNSHEDIRNNTLIIFTSDHGEMLGAHGKREKNNFYEESVRAPLIMSFPGHGGIAANTTVDEMVSHLDVFATILDYAGLSDADNSDGTSLRRFLQKESYNAEYDENFVVAEWDFRNPLPNNPVLLARTVDERPAFMIRKANDKLMIHKSASSQKIDMMFDLEKDPFELDNLLGSNADTASVATLEKAEHLRCLLLEWMQRMDGGDDKKFYSDPLANHGEGNGDIEEVRQRQSWPALDFWVSDIKLVFGSVVWDGSQYIRNEYLYVGSRTSAGASISSMYLLGNDASMFRIEASSDMMMLKENHCNRIKVTFSSPTRMDSPDDLDAFIVIQRASAPDSYVLLSFASGAMDT